MMQSGRTTDVRRYWGALLFIVLGASIGGWHNRTTDHGHRDLIAGTVRGIIAPPVLMTERLFHWIGDHIPMLFHDRSLLDENRRLEEQVEILQSENDQLRENRIDIDRLRQDLGFVRHMATPPLAAEVIARRPDPKFDTLIISQGSRDGVQPNSVVVTRKGLVGRVTEVETTTASVLMVTDQNSGVGARVQRAGSRATGVIKGDNSPLLSLAYLPNDASIKLNDTVVTSGLGGVYPAGVVIGKVKEIKTDEGGTLKTARVIPQVDLDRLEEVYVLR